MSFNNGFLCKDCGPVEKARKGKLNKVDVLKCYGCGGIVKVWTRPLNERAGRCSNCAGAKFTLAMLKGRLLRNCPKCEMVIDVDSGKTIREGKKEYEYKPNKQRIR